jgi:hypothetical protein
MLDAILKCLCYRTDSDSDALEEKRLLDFPDDKARPLKTTQALASDILSTLYAANKNDEHLAQSLQDIVHETGWYESLAVTVLNGLENALKAGAPMGEAVNDAFQKSTAAATEFAKEHPVFCTVVALGILVLLAPWAIEALGFGELGPIEGMSVVIHV